MSRICTDYVYAFMRAVYDHEQKLEKEEGKKVDTTRGKVGCQVVFKNGKTIEVKKAPRQELHRAGANGEVKNHNGTA